MKTDYEKFLEEMGVTPEQMEEALKAYIEYIPNASDRLELFPSQIHGQGMFSCDVFEPEEKISDGMISGKWTEAGRYANHDKEGNMEAVRNQRGFHFVASKLILPREELTVNYRSVRKALEGGPL